MYVVVIQRPDHPTPTAVGPFNTSDKAVGFANTIARFVEGKVTIANLEPVPPDYI